jgi:integrase
MASIRVRRRADGTTAYAVLYKLNDTQTAATFGDQVSAEEFRAAVNSIGAERAMKAWGIGHTTRIYRPKGPTVGQWCEQYIESRTGVTKSTIYDYRAYLKHDIAPILGELPLSVLTRDDVARFIKAMQDKGLAGKTMKNRHGFLSAALNAAVKSELIPSNPALGTRIPRTETGEMVFLTQSEYALLRQGFTQRWRPMLDFMVVSGMRFGELSALKPDDVDAELGTVRIARAWKRTYEATPYEIGPTKTVKSTRTINIDADVLKALNYDHEWLFVNTKGKPIVASDFRAGVWYPSVTRAKKLGLKKRPRIHDMRHTCASWMIADGTPLHVVQRHLGHENISTTVGTYGHLDRKDAEAAAHSIGKRLGTTKPDESKV